MNAKTLEESADELGGIKGIERDELILKPNPEKQSFNQLSNRRVVKSGIERLSEETQRRNKDKSKKILLTCFNFSINCN